MLKHVYEREILERKKPAPFSTHTPNRSWLLFAADKICKSSVTAFFADMFLYFLKKVVLEKLKVGFVEKR